MVQLEIYTITEEFTLKVVFLNIYIFIRLGMLLLEVCHSYRYTSASDTPFLYICHFPKCVIHDNTLLPAIHFYHRYTSVNDTLLLSTHFC